MLDLILGLDFNDIKNTSILEVLLASLKYLILLIPIVMAVVFVMTYKFELEIKIKQAKASLKKIRNKKPH